MSEYLDFMTEDLVPAANGILRETYDRYCGGGDIDVRSKSDFSPASTADRRAEIALRSMIKDRYPDHGIWGEEFGAENLNSEYVWVLDPLDGTREFLDRKPGQFGVLIGLLQNRRPIAGVISDPMRDDVWSGLASRGSFNKRNISLARSIVACTNSGVMFDEGTFEPLANTVSKVEIGLNCIGFVNLIDGDIDAVVENDLSLHDIAALIPILSAAGCSAIDFKGRSYSDMQFDLSQAGEKKYGIIAASCSDLAADILGYFKGYIS